MTDRAGNAYWDDVWGRAELALPVNKRTTRIQSYVTRRLQGLFDRHVAHLPAQSCFIEIGCANSPWLSYFATEHRFKVAGLDYSPVGCQKTRELLKRDGVVGEVVDADMFDPPRSLYESFDVALSQGVVEHFADTTEPIAAIANLLRPGGTMITTIPNMAGISGPLQRVLNHAVYDVHVPLTAEELTEAHLRAGLRLVASGYFVPLNPSVCNLGELRGLRRSIPAFLMRQAARATYLVWLFDERITKLPETRAFAPWAYCVAVKPSEGHGETA